MIWAAGGADCSNRSLQQIAHTDRLQTFQSERQYRHAHVYTIHIHSDTVDRLVQIRFLTAHSTQQRLYQC